MLYEKDYHMYYKYTRCPENRTMGYGMCGYWQLKAHRIIWQHIGFRICAVFISESIKALPNAELGEVDFRSSSGPTEMCTHHVWTLML